MSSNFTLWRNKRREGLLLGDAVVIQSRGIRISRKFSTLFSSSYAEVYVDTANKSIGIRPLKTASDDSYKMEAQNKRFRLNVKSLIRFLRITPKQYLAYWDEAQGLLVFKYETETP